MPLKITEKFKKRFDERYIRYCKAKSVNIDRAHYKAYNAPFSVYLIDGWLDFYCIGHFEAIKELLNYLDGIGGKKKLGFGKIMDMKIEKVDNVQIFRRIPYVEKELKPGIFYGVGAVVPPYFKNENERVYFIGELK